MPIVLPQHLKSNSQSQPLVDANPSGVIETNPFITTTTATNTSTTATNTSTTATNTSTTATNTSTTAKKRTTKVKPDADLGNQLWPVKRVYRTPVGMRASVTSIIEATTDEKSKKALHKWRQDKIAAGEDPDQLSNDAKERGTLIHRLREKYIRQGIIEYVSDEIDDLFIPLTYYYDRFNSTTDSYLWCEGPMPALLKSNPDASQYYWLDPEDGQRKGSLFHQDLPYAGCPDDLAIVNGWLMLIDLKTSKRKYHPVKPEPPSKYLWAEHGKERQAGIEGPAHEQIRQWRELNAGWLSFYKCGLQLTAYKRLIKKALHLDVEKMGVLVCCPLELNNNKPQFITLTDEHQTLFQADWEERVKTFILKADIPSIDLKDYLNT